MRVMLLAAVALGAAAYSVQAATPPVSTSAKMRAAAGAAIAKPASTGVTMGGAQPSREGVKRGDDGGGDSGGGGGDDGGRENRNRPGSDGENGNRPSGGGEGGGGEGGGGEGGGGRGSVAGMGASRGQLTTPGGQMGAKGAAGLKSSGLSRDSMAGPR